MTESIDLALAREIAARLDPDALLDYEDTAAMLKCSARYVAEVYAKAPGFPSAIRFDLGNGQRSQPRYKRSAIAEYIDRQARGIKPQGGRARRRPGV